MRARIASDLRGKGGLRSSALDGAYRARVPLSPALPWIAWAIVIITLALIAHGSDDRNRFRRHDVYQPRRNILDPDAERI